jgi:hypothetical protein
VSEIANRFSKGDASMKKRNLKGAALVLLSSGCMFGAFGCLSDIAGLAFRGLPGSILSELLIDSDAVFDLFGDSNDATEVF